MHIQDLNKKRRKRNTNGVVVSSLEATVEALLTLLMSSSESPTLKEPQLRYNKTAPETHDSSASSSMNSDDLMTFLAAGRGLGRLKIIHLRRIPDDKVKTNTHGVAVLALEDAGALEEGGALEDAAFLLGGMVDR